MRIECEWGLRGLKHLLPTADVVIIVDVLSFSTAVDVAVDRGGRVYPYPQPDDELAEFARGVDAELAGRRGECRYSLSPRCYENIAPEDIDVIGNESSEWLVDFTIDCANAYVPGLPTLKIIDAAVTASDHSSFWNAGYDALLGIEDRGVPYPYYHTVNDTLGNITMPFATDVTRMGIAALAELAMPDSAASVAGKGETESSIAGVYPNPFSGSTMISFVLAGKSHVEAGVYDVEGRLVRTLLGTDLPAGAHELRWDGRDADGRQVAQGIYFTKIDTGREKLSSKVIVLR